jgi:uncharacterized protein
VVKKAVLAGIGTFFLILGFWWSFFRPGPTPPAAQLKPAPKPLLAYTLNSLRQREYSGSDIEFTRKLKDGADYSVWQFQFESDGKKVSGAANLPADVATASALTRPVIVMLRGYAPVEDYYPGYGTEHLAALLAGNGFVTLAPDFLGYGDSANPSTDVFEERFQTYTTVLNLMAGVCHPGGRSPIGSSQKDAIASLQHDNCGLWGHSNGGQIALSVLAISGKDLPTVLWNPVSITFPYSILYYTWDSDDHGKALRKNLAKFEADYDTELYSVTNYLDWIKAPILLQQGSADESVPQKWSDDLAKKLAKVDYIVYSGADHNMLPRWDAAASDTLKFFESNL